MTVIQRVVVVVPAHNEAPMLPRCLTAIRTAAAAVSVPVDIVVVLDACDDDSAAVAELYGSDVTFLPVDERNVGAARAAGFRHAPRNGAWYATTDADTVVDPDWLVRQLDSEADAVLGVVRVGEWRNRSAEVVDAYLQGYADDADDADAPGHRHIHGANMGFTAESYWAVGGFNPLRSGEDVDLVERFEAAGAVIDWNDELSVTTSDRLDARAPGGFAEHLDEVARQVQAPEAS